MMGLKSKVKTFIKFYKEGDKYIFKRIFKEIYKSILRKYFKIRKHKGLDIIKEDWDYLIILDACRYDTFVKYRNVLDPIKNEHSLKKKISIGSCTNEWIRKLFYNKKTEIIYITSNPMYKKYNVEKSFKKVEPVWEYGWSEKDETVRPEDINKATIKCLKKYPNERFLIHYMQPHAPFIGETKIAKKNKNKTLVLDIQDEVEYGKFDIELVKKAYEDNLKLALKYVKELLPHLKGKVVISADHGEAFGEKKIYFHTDGIHIKPLIEIPWLEINQGKKRKIHEKELIEDIKI